MKCIYKLRVDQILDKKGDIHTVYGIEAWKKQQCIQSIGDIFFDFQRAEEFVARCNQSELSIIHLMDVISDILE